MTLIGTVANIVTFITLKKKTNLFSKAIRLLFMNQSIVDGAACLGATILIVQVNISLLYWRSISSNSFGNLVLYLHANFLVLFYLYLYFYVSWYLNCL